MQRVDPPVLDGAPRRHERLGRHLAAEDPLALLVGLHAPEDVDLDGLEVEQVDEEVRASLTAHPGRLPATGADVGPGRRRGRRLPCGGRDRSGSGHGPASRRLSRRLPLGDGHRRPPDRGRQRQQRLVGVRARPHLRVRRVSGDACDSFHRWPEDIALVADLGLGAYRFSLEWSRIEPAEGEFSLAALDHYRRMCGHLPRSTASPRWSPSTTSPTPAGCRTRGGWEAPDAPERFARFCERVTAHLGDLIGMGLHPQRAQRRGHHGVAPRDRSRPGSRDRVRRGAVNAGPGRAPTAWPSRPSGPARATSRSDSPCRWPTSRSSRGRGVAASGSRRPSEDVFLRGHRRATTSSACSATPACSSAPTGPWPPNDGRARRPRWATSSGPRPSSTPSAGPGR